MLSPSLLRETLTTVLDRAMPGLAGIAYRLVGTGAALLQGVRLPAADIDLLMQERQGVDLLASALASFKCHQPPVWFPDSNRQYYAHYEVNGVQVEISTVELETDSDAIECFGRGPWEHYVLVSCGPYAVPAVALELRLVSELARDRPARYKPLIQHMQVTGCDTELVRRGMEARGLPQAVQDQVFGQLGGAPVG